MKSERLKGLNHNFSSFDVKTLPKQYSEYNSNDNEEYYPFVIGRGNNFKFIDPKVYKQLRKNNLPQTKHIRIAECAKKNSRVSNTRHTSTSQSFNDEYCELSPLASGPAPYIPPRRLKKQPKISDKRLQSTILTTPITREPVVRNTSSRPRVENEYYDPKACMVKVNSINSVSKVSTELCKDLVDLKRDLHLRIEDESSEEKDTRTYICGHDSEEVVDVFTCMCCAKGLFYHCTKDSEDEGRIADDPCSCSGPIKSCLPRWGCLAVLSIFLPCLFCYLPIAACRKTKTCISCKKNKKKSRK